MSPRARRSAVVAWVVALTSAALAAIAFAAEGDLSFLEVEKDGVGGADGLNGANAVVVSPDGKHVYVASSTDDAIAVFSRDPGDGTIEFVDVAVEGVDGVEGLDNPAGLAISPDGGSVYAAAFNSDSVVGFSRDSATGELSILDLEPPSGENQLDAAIGIAVTADGTGLYVTSKNTDALTIFSRDPSTGLIDLVGFEQDDVGGVSGLDEARGVTSSPDGRHIYVSSAGTDNSVVTFARDDSTQELDFVEAETDGTGGVETVDGGRGVAVSPDGRHVLVTAVSDDALTSFSRDPTTGDLDLADAEVNGVGGVVGLNGATWPAISPDGKNVYVASSAGDAVAGFMLNPLTGELAFDDVVDDGVDGVDGLDLAFGAAVTSDGKNLYTAAILDDALAAFAREPDLTAPDTSIDAGPPAETPDATPAFEFSSDDPGFTDRFECRIDGAAFAKCESPLETGPLALGAHIFEVRAVDTAQNADATPATSAFEVVDEVVEGAASAKRKQKQKGKRVVVEVKIEAAEDLDARLTGKVAVPGKDVPLGPVERAVAGDATKSLKLKPAKKSGARKVSRTLDRDSKAKASLKARLSDAAGNSETSRLKVKLR